MKEVYLYCLNQLINFIIDISLIDSSNSLYFNFQQVSKLITSKSNEILVLWYSVIEAGARRNYLEMEVKFFIEPDPIKNPCSLTESSKTTQFWMHCHRRWQMAQNFELVISDQLFSVLLFAYK